ncbi:uncharacterized protein SPAPADRAFT_62902 [Spathaspora passalidarum NRRL Y-27907]|uniref:ABC1 atypical kinase-like domain-containing protein n=1 Tax=Spathaspora passalidarum (strain NRRL Y-27907 / 11-Y1) TaxID=619300 RepID=G3AS47_SPAPN|nr:uncharacterized protein SPAPADRAFT_62902 [Spathaspora passalidarum NRRL Y-27907]EGW31006.1 hypothetical protein SPAPADRAFT_62902 [Spathaspora passalidarum NRRL Y-27907]
MKNKGLYIKLGQAIANQGTLFPRAYQVRFPKLYDDASFDEWYRIDNVLKTSLGEDYQDRYFESIETTPCASASIAQVHRGVLKPEWGGAKVAIKVQHDYIDKQIVVDLMVYRLMSRVYQQLFDIPMTMFTKYVSEQMITETDFIHEMGNSKRLEEFIANDKQLNVNVYVPKTYPEITTRKVLVAEWIDGISLTSKEKLLQENYNLTTIMKQYLKLFGRQIFEYGFIHSDPHPGNLLARFDEKGKQQLVILDHGLYITLSNEFRLQYCNLWRYIFSLNNQGIEQIGKSWGINSVEVFATLVQLKPVLIKPESAAEARQDTRDAYDLLRDFIGDEGKFPGELPFLSRTMRMIQNLNQTFGSPVNRINLLTKESVNALLDEKLTFSDFWDVLKIKLTLSLSGFVFYMIRFRQWLYGDRFGEGRGFEDYVEIYMQNTAKSLGLEWI